jgi:hypothetical protein
MPLVRRFVLPRSSDWSEQNLQARSLIAAAGGRDRDYNKGHNIPIARATTRATPRIMYDRLVCRYVAGSTTEVRCCPETNRRLSG